MANPISIVGAIVKSIATVDKIFKHPPNFAAGQEESSAEYEIETRNGWGTAALLNILSPDLVPHMDTINRVLLTGPDHLSEKFRVGFVDDCKAVAVAVRLDPFHHSHTLLFI
jgi:hypothetical protein